MPTLFPQHRVGSTTGPSSPIGRRGLFATAAAGVLAMAGCGSVRWGAPERYTPPPPGIDDLYRADLLDLLERAIAEVDQVIEDAARHPPGTPGLSNALATLRDALPLQRAALLTGAEAEKEREAATDPLPGAASTTPPTGPKADVPALRATLVDLRDLTIDAARQTSGSLARPIAAIGAHTSWVASRLLAGTDLPELPAVPAPEDVVPSREVPTTDVPTIGATTDFHAAMDTAQEQHWYAGYVHEVLAARSEGTERAAHLDRSEQLRLRAEALGGLAEEHGAPTVVREAVYPLPGGEMDADTAGRMPVDLSRSLLAATLALVGAAPFAARSLPIVAVHEEARHLAPRTDRMDPLPSIVIDEATQQAASGPDGGENG